MTTRLQSRKTTARAKHDAREAWNAYVMIRRACREGKATVGELAHALAQADRAAAELAVAEVNQRN